MLRVVIPWKGSHRLSRVRTGGSEIFSGLPGTVGGAVYGNAGCYGHAVSEYIDWVEYLSCDGSLHRLYRDQYRFGYRDSPFKHHKWIITEVGFNLMPSQPIAIGQKAKEYRQMRRDKGHYRYPSMGSIFKNLRGPKVAGASQQASSSKRPD